MPARSSATEWTGISLMSRLGYLFGEGFRGIFKHGFMSFATVTIIIACLIIMGTISLLSINIDALIGDLEDQNEIVAFVDEDMANTLIWLFHDYLLGRRCRECGRVFTDFRQENRCPFCGAADPDWNLQGNEK